MNKNNSVNDTDIFIDCDSQEEIDTRADEEIYLEFDCTESYPEDDAKSDSNEEYNDYRDVLYEDYGLKRLDVDTSNSGDTFSYDSIRALRLPGYKRSVYRTTYPLRIRNTKVIVPTFIFNKEEVKKPSGKIEEEFQNYNLKLFENYVLRCVEEQFKDEVNALLSAYALPQCVLKTIFENRGIDAKKLYKATKLSHTIHSQIMSDIDLNFKLTTLVDICWSLKIEYPVAKRLIEAYGYNLDGTMPKLLAYKYVLKYMMHFDLQTVEKFLDDNKIPRFKRKK